MNRGSSPAVVIGAGPAGIAAAAALIEREIDVVVVDRHVGIGGLWDSSNPESPCRPDVTLVTPASTMGFDGLPLSSKDAYPSQAEVLTYLRAVAAERIPTTAYRLGSAVETCKPVDDGRLWALRLSSGETLTARAVVACTGSFWDPNIPPDWSAPSRGQWIHSRGFRPEEIRQGESLRIVGAGNSAADVARSAYRAGAEIFLDWRTTPWFLPRFIGETPAEAVPLQVEASPPHLRGREVQRQLASRAESTARRFEELSDGRRPTSLPYEGPTIIGDELLTLLGGEGEGVQLYSERQAQVDFDLTVLATGYTTNNGNTGDWLSDIPRDSSGLVAYGYPGYYSMGGVVAERGGFWLFSLMAEAVAELVDDRLRAIKKRAGSRSMPLKGTDADVLWGMQVPPRAGPRMVFSDAYIAAVKSMVGSSGDRTVHAGDPVAASG